ncbi:Helix-turn-helix [Saccharopolyspora shandongensis]|uniref:Helix-turn-helix n=2 Tax=Saccharopolyspora shandongensis TaxID=418495 RepID=A0A1H3U4H4_9PSEU|nr:Helix-turn-helix [Saccharopolyspora shandongensis]
MSYVVLMADPRGTNIRTLREQRGVNRSDFAAAVGVSYKHLYGIETGTNTAAVETLYRIANHLGVDIDQVMAPSKVGAA